MELLPLISVLVVARPLSCSELQSPGKILANVCQSISLHLEMLRVINTVGNLRKCIYMKTHVGMLLPHTGFCLNAFVDFVK